MISSCYSCAGQRCMAASAVVPVGKEMYETIYGKFIEASREVLVADPLDPRVAGEEMVMGPVISAKARKFIPDMIERGVEEGATLAFILFWKRVIWPTDGFQMKRNPMVLESTGFPEDHVDRGRNLPFTVNRNEDDPCRKRQGIFMAINTVYNIRVPLPTWRVENGEDLQVLE